MNNPVGLDIFKEIMEQVKIKKPLVHHLTNYVTVNDCANMVLALGGSPIMADYIGEVEEILPKADALVVNLGTLNQQKADSILRACGIANVNNIPIILDPVGVSASSFRLAILNEIISNHSISIIKGNASEIRIIAGLSGQSKGVDATEGMEVSTNRLEKLSKDLRSVIVVTGQKDYITYKDKTIVLSNGSKHLVRLTGTGCMIGSIIGTYAGVTSNHLAAATLGVLAMGVAGELSHDTAEDKGMGSFKVSIFDTVSNLNIDVLHREVKMNYVK